MLINIDVGNDHELVSFWKAAAASIGRRAWPV
jgi:hypothetical protein